MSTKKQKKKARAKRKFAEKVDVSFDKYLESLETAKYDFEVSCRLLGHQIREEVVIPFCKKNKLTFTCNSFCDYYFMDNKGRKYEVLSRKNNDEVDKMLLFLSREFSYNYPLALAVGDVVIGNGKKDVHTEHCCVYHGCKYSDYNCTVVSKKLKQSFSCGEASVCFEDWA